MGLIGLWTFPVGSTGILTVVWWLALVSLVCSAEDNTDLTVRSTCNKEETSQELPCPEREEKEPSHEVEGWCPLEDDKETKMEWSVENVAALLEKLRPDIEAREKVIKAQLLANAAHGEVEEREPAPDPLLMDMASKIQLIHEKQREQQKQQNGSPWTITPSQGRQTNGQWSWGWQE